VNVPANGLVGYLDCFSGASGDMVLAAALDAGADLDAVHKQVEAVVGPLELRTVTVHRTGIRASKLVARPERDVRVRTYAEACRLLADAALDPEVGAAALGVLERMVDAEAHVHGVEREAVHLHEVSGADTLIDAVGVAAALRSLGIDRLVCSAVATGRGTVPSEHGLLPVPAPAALELLKDAPVVMRDVDAELVTPTGAAIIAAFARGFGLMPAMTVRAVGYGAGERDLDGLPNVVRLIVGEPLAGAAEPVAELLVEATIDDMSPELYEYVVERLFDAGASDVWLVPAVGRRGRPATVLTALAAPEREGAVRAVIVAETSTIGLRATTVRKWMLTRDWITVEVEGRPVRVKVAREAGVLRNAAPEYQDCAAVARETGLPLKTVFQQALQRASIALEDLGRD
jgi:pyridinium-3,5-bisthiocarboxylic acid mononucleotide nickel chelatase